MMSREEQIEKIIEKAGKGMRMGPISFCPVYQKNGKEPIFKFGVAVYSHQDSVWHTQYGNHQAEPTIVSIIHKGMVMDDPCIDLMLKLLGIDVYV